jgi:hypothetical protein
MLKREWDKELEAIKVDPDIDKVVRIVFVAAVSTACSFLLIGTLMIAGVLT